MLNKCEKIYQFYYNHKNMTKANLHKHKKLFKHKRIHEAVIHYNSMVKICLKKNLICVDIPTNLRKSTKQI